MEFADITTTSEESEIDLWQQRNVSQSIIICFQILSEGTVLAVCDVIVLVLLTLVRKRCEIMFSLVPLCLCVSEGFRIYITLQMYEIIKLGESKDFEQNRPFFYACSNFFLVTAHWLFVMQYMRSSLILAKVFN